MVTLVTVHNAGASTIIDRIDPQEYRDEASLYPSVGKVTGAIFGGSGVLISDRWVLTAGHVALNKAGGTVTIGGTGYIVQSSVTYPGYAYPNNAYDLGLLYLSTPVAGVTPARMLGLDSPASILGREATWVGHGRGGTGLSGEQSPFDFRAFTNVIDVFGTEYGLTGNAFVADFDDPDGAINAPGSDPTASRLEGNLTSGDSGGGVFVTVDGERYLVGINSFAGGFTPGTNSKYGSISGAMNLQLFHSWIFAQTGISAVPEPDVLWLCAPGLLFAVARRRRPGN